MCTVAQHTSGKYKAAPNNDANGTWYVFISPGLNRARFTIIADNLTEASARLIAAAPDLLKALESIWDHGLLAIHPDDSEYCRDEKANALAAIAKARGEE